MLAAFEGTGWTNEMSDDEKAFIEGTPLRWDPQSVIDASWRVESVACLLWALRLVEDLPPFDAPAGQEILRHVPTKDAADFVMRAELLPPERIGRKREEAELWHWRSRTRQLEEMGLEPDVPGFDTFDAVVRFVAADLERKGILPETIDGDFAARGKAFRDLAASEWAEARSIILERHRGLNWLCGHAPENRWDQTPTDA